MHLVISPHLDDAVLSCGTWLAARPGATVLTLFAGAPRDPSRRTDWDAQSGFASAGEAIAERRREDAQALALLDATPRWLDFTDGQYGESSSVEMLAAALCTVLRDLRPGTVLYPLGLFHADHRLAHDAAVVALQGLGDLRITAHAYEDVPYRGMPGVLQQRLAELADIGLQATPVRHDAVPAAAAGDRGADDRAARKARAVAAYVSQLRAFAPGGLPDAESPERRWRLDEAAGGSAP